MGLTPHTPLLKSRYAARYRCTTRPGIDAPGGPASVEDLVSDRGNSIERYVFLIGLVARVQ